MNHLLNDVTCICLEYCFGSNDKLASKSWLLIWSYLLWALNCALIWKGRNKERPKLPGIGCSDHERIQEPLGGASFGTYFESPATLKAREAKKISLSLSIHSANNSEFLLSALSSVRFQEFKSSISSLLVCCVWLGGTYGNHHNTECQPKYAQRLWEHWSQARSSIYWSQEDYSES